MLYRYLDVCSSCRFVFLSSLPSFLYFFFNDTATTEIYTLSLHDALPISWWPSARSGLRIVPASSRVTMRSEEHTSELQSRENLVCRLLLEKKKKLEIAVTEVNLQGSCVDPVVVRLEAVGVPQHVGVDLDPQVGFFFFFNDTATTEIYTLSLHDALPIWRYLLDVDFMDRLRAVFLPTDHPDRKSTRLNSSHVKISYAVFCLKKKKTK